MIKKWLNSENLISLRIRIIELVIVISKVKTSTIILVILASAIIGFLRLDQPATNRPPNVIVFNFPNITIYTSGEPEIVKDTRKKAKQGDANARFNLGNFYYLGKIVPQDKDEAVKWWRKAAIQRHAGAQSNLGGAYYLGEGVDNSSENIDKNRKEAVEWWRKAAEQGDYTAQYNLGSAYYYGEGVDKCNEKAVKWWRKAAKQGHARAQSNLASSYDFGEGIDKDKDKAVKWYLKAAEQGIAEAQFSLALFYWLGKDNANASDKRQGYIWLIIAKLSGFDVKGLQNDKGWEDLFKPGEKESAWQEANKKYMEIESRRTKE